MITAPFNSGGDSRDFGDSGSFEEFCKKMNKKAELTKGSQRDKINYM